MADFTNYAELIVYNINIWQQAIMMGILVVCSGGLMGFLLSSISVFFKMVSRG